jgi:CubicO group peptidase (beta-lactamase class C family)
MQLRITILLLSTFYFGTSTLKAQSLYYPPLTGSVWDSLSATQLGWCTGAPIDSLYSFLNLRNTKAFLVLKDGKIVLEKYFGNHTVDSNWYWASAGKTLTAFAVGVAQEKGLLNIQDKTSQYLSTGWTICTPQQEDSITIWHQLTMTTGLDDNVPDDNCTVDTCLIYKASAGNRWAYHNAPYRLLHDVVDSSSSSTWNGFLTQEIKSKCGMNGTFFNGVYYSTARSMARFGLVLLGKGKWGATSILGDTVFLNNMANTSQNKNLGYGYLTWLNGKSSYMLPQSQLVVNGPLVPNAPADMYAAIGKDGQIINVVPSKNLVVIRMGNNPNDGALVTTVFNNDLWSYLNAVICTPSDVNTVQAEQPRLEIYPNPSTDLTRIRVPNSNEKDRKLIVTNMQGQLVYQVAIGSNAQITFLNTSGWGKGLYVIRLTDQPRHPVKLLVH